MSYLKFGGAYRSWGLDYIYYWRDLGFGCGLTWGQGWYNAWLHCGPVLLRYYAPIPKFLR